MPTEPFFRPKNIRLMLFFWTAHIKEKPEMNGVIVYFGFTLSYWHVQQQIGIKNMLKEETFLIRYGVPGASTFV